MRRSITLRIVVGFYSVVSLGIFVPFAESAVSQRGRQQPRATYNAQLSQELWHSARRGELATVQALLAKQADPNAKNETGVTALMVATASGHQDVFQALLANGANVDAKDNHGRSALSIAAVNENTEA